MTFLAPPITPQTTPLSFLESLRPLVADASWWAPHWQDLCKTLPVFTGLEAEPADIIAAARGTALSAANLRWERDSWLDELSLRARRLVDPKPGEDPQAVALRIIDAAIALGRGGLS